MSSTVLPSHHPTDGTSALMVRTPSLTVSSSYWPAFPVTWQSPKDPAEYVEASEDESLLQAEAAVMARHAAVTPTRRVMRMRTPARRSLKRFSMAASVWPRGDRPSRALMSEGRSRGDQP